VPAPPHPRAEEINREEITGEECPPHPRQGISREELTAEEYLRRLPKPAPLTRVLRELVERSACAPHPRDEEISGIRAPPFRHL
jgi:hypothetical protein